MDASKRFGRRTARRAFVRLAAASALTVPAWIRVAFGENACPPGRPKATGTFTSILRWDQVVARAFGRAADAGKPLLVLVATQRDWHRAEAFGELLNHGSDGALALLGLCEVVCAPLAAVNRLVPRMPQSAHEPLMVLIETNALPARATALDVPLPDIRDVALEELSDQESDIRTEKANRRWPEAYERKEKKVDERVSQRIRLLTDMLRNSLAPSEAAIAVRAEASRIKLGSHRGANTFIKAQSITAAEVKNNSKLADLVSLAAASLLQLAYAANGNERARLTNLVAEATRVVLCKRRIAGSRWAKSEGCGVQIEWLPGEEPESGFGFACGMGHVPARSRRILDFLTFDQKAEGNAP